MLLLLLRLLLPRSPPRPVLPLLLRLDGSSLDREELVEEEKVEDQLLPRISMLNSSVRPSTLQGVLLRLLQPVSSLLHLLRLP